VLFCCRNLFQQQRLLSLDSDDIDQLVVRRPDILPRGIRQSQLGVMQFDNSESVHSVFDSGTASLLQSAAVLGTAGVVCGFGMQFCRRRRRQRRKHLTPAARRSRIAR